MNAPCCAAGAEGEVAGDITPTLRACVKLPRPPFFDCFATFLFLFGISFGIFYPIISWRKRPDKVVIPRISAASSFKLSHANTPSPVQIMFMSTKRAIALTCAIFVFVLISGYESIKHNYITSPLNNILKNTTVEPASSILDIKPFWTTEQLEPRFAYVQYATDIDYFCNAVSLLQAPKALRKTHAL